MQTLIKPFTTTDYQQLINQLNLIIQYDRANKISTGEIICPECHTGNLCYFVSDKNFISIECSTSGCIHWDGHINEQ